MESQPQNPECRINPESFIHDLVTHTISFYVVHVVTIFQSTGSEGVFLQTHLKCKYKQFTLSKSYVSITNKQNIINLIT